MRFKLIFVVMLTVLLVSMSILMFKTQPVEASPEETVVTYFTSAIDTVTTSVNHSDPSTTTYHYSFRWNMTFSSPDANGIINLTIPKESFYCEPFYRSVENITRQFTMTSDGYGKLYTLNDTGDVDVITMTNNTGTFFWKDGAWHPPGEELIGDGNTDPAGSAFWHATFNTTLYRGNGTDGPVIGKRSLGDVWTTTGFSESIIIEPASRLNGSYMKSEGIPLNGVGGVGIFVHTFAKLNDTFLGPLASLGPVDTQSKRDSGVATPPAFMATLFSPANLYVTDPQNKHVGAHPITGDYVNEISGAFYSGPGTHPQRIVIPDPLDGVYDIKIVGTSTGSYTLVVELATVEKTTTDTHTGYITAGQILESEANISEGEMTFTPPSTPVGGIYIPVNKLQLLAPYIGLTILLAVAVVTVGYVKKRKRKSEINS